jgi:hypothetical protein
MRRYPQLTAIAGLFCALSLSGCMSTSGYGTFDGDDRPIEQQIFGNMFSVIGLQGGQDKPKPQYDARAPLVMPPSGDQLPAPQEARIQVNDPNWPVQQTNRKALKDNRKIDDHDNSSARLPLNELALEAEPVKGKVVPLYEDPTRKGYYDESSVRLSRQQMKEQDDMASLLRKKQELGPDGLPLRKYLTDPPKHLRVPSNLEAYQDPEESDSWVEKSNLKQERGYRDSGMGGSGF